MNGFSIPNMVIIASLSAGAIGASISLEGLTTDKGSGLETATVEYVDELMRGQRMIDEIASELSLSEGDQQKISTQAEELMESQYRRMRPRERFIEMIPSDSVIDTQGLEYLAAVGSRYSENVVHAARAIKKNPSKVFLNSLKTENRKAHMFDQLLLNLANVAASQESESQEIPSDPSSFAQTDEVSEKEVEQESLQGSERGEGSLIPDEAQVSTQSYSDAENEEHGITTETTISYTETTVTWSN